MVNPVGTFSVPPSYFASWGRLYSTNYGRSVGRAAKYSHTRLTVVILFRSAEPKKKNVSGLRNPLRTIFLALLPQLPSLSPVRRLRPQLTQPLFRSASPDCFARGNPRCPAYLFRDARLFRDKRERPSQHSFVGREYRFGGLFPSCKKLVPPSLIGVGGCYLGFQYIETQIYLSYKRLVYREESRPKEKSSKGLAFQHRCILERSKMAELRSNWRCHGVCRPACQLAA